MPETEPTRPVGWLSGDELDGFGTDQRQLFRQLEAADEADLPRALDELTDRELRDIQRMVGATARGNWAMHYAVGEAVLRRPHRGCWPLHLGG